MTRALRLDRSLVVATFTASALVLAACGDASVGSPRGLDYSHGGGGGTGGGGTGNTATGGGGGGTSGGGGAGGGGGGTSGGGGAGVDAGGGGGGGGGVDSGTVTPPQTAAYTVTVDKPTLASDLLAKSELTLTIAPQGYSGSVALSVMGLPTDVDTVFTPASLTLDGTTTMTAKLSITTHTSTKPGDAPFSVVVTSSSGTQSAPSTLTVHSAITIQIPSGANNLGGTTATPVRTAYGTYPIVIAAPTGISAANPVTVRFYNADSVSHEIHGSAPGAGFAHDPGSFGAGAMDPLVRKVNTTGTYDFYLHDQGGAKTVGRIVIQ